MSEVNRVKYSQVSKIQPSNNNSQEMEVHENSNIEETLTVEKASVIGEVQLNAARNNFKMETQKFFDTYLYPELKAAGRETIKNYHNAERIRVETKCVLKKVENKQKQFQKLLKNMIAANKVILKDMEVAAQINVSKDDLKKLLEKL